MHPNLTQPRSYFERILKKKKKKNDDVDIALINLKLTYEHHRKLRRFRQCPLPLLEISNLPRRRARADMYHQVQRSIPYPCL